MLSTTAMPPPASQPDIGRLRRGDPAAWEEVVRSQGGRLLAAARRIVRDDALAEDCLQNAFIQAYEKIGSFEERSLLSTWLHRIVVNAALMSVRSRGRREEEPLDDLLPVFDEYGHRVAECRPRPASPEELLGRAEARQILDEAVERLPESHRTVLVLRDFEELSTEEVAEVLDITPNAVKIRLHRARAALKTLLERPARRPDARATLSSRITGITSKIMPFTITCREFESFIMDYLDGTLPRRERLLFEVHTRSCRECRAYLKRYRATVAVGQKFGRGSAELPADAPRRLVEAIIKARSRPR
jgi:RNA polymerase sigma-70 factor (ECF subfamily)